MLLKAIDCILISIFYIFHIAHNCRLSFVC